MPPSEQPLVPNPLTLSGAFWTSRIVPEQKGLIAALAGVTEERGRFPDVAAALLTGRGTGATDCWSFGQGYSARYASRWLRPVRAAVEGNIDQPLLLQSGDTQLVMAGQRLSSEGDGIRINGFRLEDLAYQGAAATLGLPAGAYILLPGKTGGGGNFLYANVGGSELLYLTFQGTVPTAEAGLYETVLHDTWFLPCKGNPQTLLTRKGVRIRNQGFVQVDGWLAIFEDPAELWPDGVVTALASTNGGNLVRGSAMGVDHFQLGGSDVMHYLRTSQSPLRFERALSEIGGDPVPSSDLLVDKVTPAEHGHNYWSQGQTIYLAGSPEYKAGETMAAGRGTRVRVLSKWQDGEFWRTPAWDALGISSKWLWPRLPELTLRGGRYPAHAFGAPVRCRVITGQPGEEEFWDALDVNGALSAAIGLTTAGQTTTVDILDLLFTLLGERLLVVATTLHVSQPARWHLVRSWAERERPTGCVLIPALLHSIRLPSIVGGISGLPAPAPGYPLLDEDDELWLDGEGGFYLG